MARTFNRKPDDDDDNFETTSDGRRILRDGGRGRVSLMDSNSLQRGVALNLHDGRGGAPGRRNGYAFSRDEYAKDELSIAIYEYEQRLGDAWRTRPIAEAHEGDLLPDGTDDHAMRDCYATYDQQLRDAYKKS